MSILLPSEENITRLKVQPTKGEKHLLDFLKNLLQNNYEIYSQPFLNGDQPDFIIMRKNYGVMIIEVKDWDLESYYIDSNKKWRLKHNHAIIKSPIAQVKTYKENLYNLHIENLLENQIDNQKFFGIVSCAVYFHNANQETLNNFLLNAFESDNDKRYIKIFGNDSINNPKSDIKKLRDNKKFNFWMNPGNVKLSTIHSFKGWEINTLFLIIEAGITETNEHDISIDELVYTGLTRCRQNLIIINIGNSRYHSFFKELIEDDFLKT